MLNEIAAAVDVVVVAFSRNGFVRIWRILYVDFFCILNSDKRDNANMLTGVTRFWCVCVCVCMTFPYDSRLIVSITCSKAEINKKTMTSFRRVEIYLICVSHWRQRILWLNVFIYKQMKWKEAQHKPFAIEHNTIEFVNNSNEINLYNFTVSYVSYYVKSRVTANNNKENTRTHSYARIKFLFSIGKLIANISTLEQIKLCFSWTKTIYTLSQQWEEDEKWLY